MFKTPIAIFCHQRYEKTKKLLSLIKKINPYKIYIIHDGPIKKNEIENKKVYELINNVSFNHKEIISSSINLGLKKRIVSGLNAVFEKENKAIIIEDDCFPNEDFFYFCEKILEIYKNSKNISGVTGNNFQKKKVNNDEYYFSKFSHIWGWATWDHVWKDFDLDIKFWNSFKNSDDWYKIHDNVFERKFWERVYDKVYLSEINSWAYSNQLCNWYYGRLTVTPNVNLVKNFGFDNFSTNTKTENMKLIKETKMIDLSNVFEKKIIQSKHADNYVFENIYLNNKDKIKYKLYKLMHKI